MDTSVIDSVTFKQRVQEIPDFAVWFWTKSNDETFNGYQFIEYISKHSPEKHKLLIALNETIPRGRLDKGSLLPEELRSHIASKLEELTNGPATSEYTDAINKVVKIIPRTNLTKPETRDARRRDSLETISNVTGHLEEAPEFLQNLTSGRGQGSIIYKNAISKARKEIQYQWFDKSTLPEKGYTCDPETARTSSNATGKSITTLEFANALDQLSLEYLRGNDYDSERLLELISFAGRVFILRHIEDELSHNNLANASDWKNWRNHALVITSFATYLVALCVQRTKILNHGEWSLPDAI